MGLISHVKSIFKTQRGEAAVTDVKCDPGGGANKTAQHFSSAGEDCPPLSGDYAILVPLPRSGTVGAAGYVDPKNEQLAESGERRTYARDAGGAVKITHWLKGDGSFVLTNGLGTIAMDASGIVTINGVTFAPNGDIVAPTSLVLAGREINLHNHDETGTITGPNN